MINSYLYVIEFSAGTELLALLLSGISQRLVLFCI